jgi:hypothetical protein
MGIGVHRGALTDPWHISGYYALHYKVQKYADEIADLNNHAASGMSIAFMPIVFNHWGGLNKAGYEWLSAIAKTRSNRVSSGEGEESSSHRSSGSAYLYQKLSIALHHAQYRMVQKRCSPQNLRTVQVLEAMSGDARVA